MKKKIQLKQQYTAQEAAAILGVSAMTIYRLVNAGKLAARKLGDSKCSHLRIAKTSLEAYLGAPIDAPVEVDVEENSTARDIQDTSTPADVIAAELIAATAALKTTLTALATQVTQLQGQITAIERHTEELAARYTEGRP